MQKTINRYGESKRTRTREENNRYYRMKDGRPVSAPLSNDLMLFGMEVETCFPNMTHTVSAGQTLEGFDDETVNLFDIETDGSLNGEGFEMISRTMTREAMDYWLKSPDMRAIMNASIDGHCNGIHIHVSKTSRWELVHTRRMIAIMYTLGPRLEEMTRSTRYARWYHDEFTSSQIRRMVNPQTVEDVELIEDVVGYGHDGRRYHCVNFNNDHTVEFRFFNYTNDIERLMKYLNFVQNVMRVVMVTDWAPERFLDEILCLDQDWTLR